MFRTPSTNGVEMTRGQPHVRHFHFPFGKDLLWLNATIERLAQTRSEQPRNLDTLFVRSFEPVFLQLLQFQARSVGMEHVRGPFRTLQGRWTLTPIGAAGTRIELSLRFAFANALTAAVFEPLFEQTASSLVDAFVARARAIPA